MSTAFNRRVRTTRAPGAQRVTIRTKRRPWPITGPRPRAFRGPVRQSQQRPVTPARSGEHLTAKLVDAVIRRHTTPAWCRRIAELWKERRA